MSKLGMDQLLVALNNSIPSDRGMQAEIAEFLGVSEPFVSKGVKRGWFAIDRARAL